MICLQCSSWLSYTPKQENQPWDRGEPGFKQAFLRPWWIFVGVHTWIVLVKHDDPYWIPIQADRALLYILQPAWRGPRAHLLLALGSAQGPGLSPLLGQGADQFHPILGILVPPATIAFSWCVYNSDETMVLLVGEISN